MHLKYTDIGCIMQEASALRKRAYIIRKAEMLIMKITFLGTSHGVPEANRRCSSALIEVAENRYIIDMGTQSIEQIATKRIPINSIKSIFITHMHGDHSNGLISFVDLCSWFFKTADPCIYLPGDIESTKAAMAAWLKCNGVNMRSFRFMPVEEGQIYDDGIIRVTAFGTKHIANSYAYLVEGEGKRVLFSGDLCHKGPQEDFPISVLDAPLDLAICESAHFAATAYLPLFEGKSNLKRLCFNHYSDVWLSTVLQMEKGLLPDCKVFRVSDGNEIVL